MSDNMTISPAYAGFGGAITGAVLGYLGAPRKYDLQQIITHDEAVFKQVFTDDVFQNVQGIKKTALDSIVKARNTLIEAKRKGNFEAKLGECLYNAELSKNYSSVKDFIPKSRGGSTLAGAVALGLLAFGIRLIFWDIGEPQKKPPSRYV